MSENSRRISSFGTMRAFLKLGSCSEALVYVLNRAYNRDLRLEEHSASALAGGIYKLGHQCGMLWGATLAAGAELFSRCGAGAQTESLAISAARRLTELFQSSNDAINCCDLTHTDWKSPARIFVYFLKGGPYRCIRMSAKYANEALRELDGFLAGHKNNVADIPVSCSAETARRLGASEMQCAMTAGFAGGIGLSGAACGALAAAVWLLAIEYTRQGVKDVFTSTDFNTKAEALISRFLEASGGKFECAEICGRNFASTSEHTDYLKKGGCTRIIAALTEQAEN